MTGLHPPPLTDLLPGSSPLDDPALGLLLLACVALGGFAQGVTGMGFLLVAAPALLRAYGHAEGVATGVVLGACASLVPLLREGRHAQPRTATGLLAVTLLATPGVAWLVRDLDHDLLALAGGLGVVAGVVLLATGVRSTALRRPGVVVATGVSSAVLNVVGGVGGPPVGMWMANADLTPAQTRATLHGFLLVQNTVTALVLGWVWPAWPLLVALALGVEAGMVVAPRLSARAARAGILVVSAVGGVALLAGSV